MRYTSQHKAETRVRFLKSAAVVAKRSGLVAASVDRIATSAGITGGVLYSHFPSKGELFIALVAQEIESSMLIRLAYFGSRHPPRHAAKRGRQPRRWRPLSCRAQVQVRRIWLIALGFGRRALNTCQSTKTRARARKLPAMGVVKKSAKLPSDNIRPRRIARASFFLARRVACMWGAGLAAMRAY